MELGEGISGLEQVEALAEMVAALPEAQVLDMDLVQGNR